MSPLYYLLAAVLAGVLLANADRVQRAEQTLAGYRSAEERTDTLVRELAERLTLGLYSGASDKARERAAVGREAEFHRDRVVASAWGLAGLSAAFLLWLLWRERGPSRRLGVHLLGVSAVCLFVGLLAPIMTVVAQREVVVLGTVVLQHETRSVITTGVHLARGGNVTTAVLLFVFSVAVPVMKLAASFAAAWARSARTRWRLLTAITFIGKWAMTDVFVVAVLLAFLTMRGQAFTDASIGPGLYFFASYGVLSLLAVQALARTYRRTS